MQTTQINEDQYALNKTQHAIMPSAPPFFEDNEEKLLKWLYQVVHRPLIGKQL